MNLSDRIRPNVEAAPWVIEEVKKLEQQLARDAEHAAMYRFIRAYDETRRDELVQELTGVWPKDEAEIDRLLREAMAKGAS